MNILVCSRQVMFCVKNSSMPQQNTALPGGLNRKINNEIAALRKRGHNVDVFDGHSVVDPECVDAVYLVGASIYTESLCRDVLSNNLKLVVAPVYDNFHRRAFVKAASLASHARRIHTNPGSIKSICQAASSVCVSSDAELDEIHDIFRVGLEKIFIVPNYVSWNDDMAKAKPESFVHEYGLSDYLLCVGAIGNPRKNMLRLIRVAGRMRVPTVIIGPESHTEYARACREAASDFRDIHIIGHVSDDMLWSAYAAADTLIMPSLVETTGLVAMEAGLMGANVISTKNGGASYYLDHFAEYIDPYSESSIGEAIAKTFGMAKSKGLKNHVLHEFNAETVGLALEKALSFDA